jgi:hypothetical protein
MSSSDMHQGASCVSVCIVLGVLVLAGISTILSQLVSKLPTALPSSRQACADGLAGASGSMASLQRLLAAAALTLADALLDR